MRQVGAALAALLVLFAGADVASAKGVKLKRIGSFAQPVGAVAAPGDKRRVYVVEQAGRIMIAGRRTPFLDIRGRTLLGAEQGLLSVAFAPDFARSKRFYVYYSRKNGDNRIAEFRARSRTRASAGSERPLLDMPTLESNHNGGLLQFGPDGLLYAGTGDGGGGGDRHGSRGNAQDTTSLLGKLLRIDPRASGDRPYTIPPSNPFAGAEGPRPEIYSYGLRNPWRFSFDRRTGDLAIADVGQERVEEIDFVRRGRGRGANFGWRVFEGNERFSQGEQAAGHRRPVLTVAHADGYCSITGGVVVRDRRLRGLYGRYLFGDFCKPQISSTKLKLPKASAPKRTGLAVNALAAFGEDGRGRVLVVSAAGPVSRIVPR